MKRSKTFLSLACGLALLTTCAIQADETPQPHCILAACHSGSYNNYNGSYPICTHWLGTVSNGGYYLQIEDGSQWQINSSDIYILNSWRIGDALSVSPNTGWFSSEGFYIKNQVNNTYIRANVINPPVPFGNYSHWIIQIDHMTGHLTLENGLTWCIQSSDEHIFREWEVNDHLVIGENSAYFTSYDHILINTNMNSYARAKQY